MIKLQEAEIIDLLPAHISQDIKIQALSYAIRLEMNRLAEHTARVESISDIDSMDHDLLDYFAVEWRTQYYDPELDIDKKRELIKNTLNWHRHAGTIPVVQELIDIVFGGAEITEWYDMGTDPGTFAINLFDDIQVTPELVARFAAMIQKAKNTRSHLAAIGVIRDIDQDIYIGVAKEFSSVWNIDAEDYNNDVIQGLYLATMNAFISTWNIDTVKVDVPTLIKRDTHIALSNIWASEINIDAVKPPEATDVIVPLFRNEAMIIISNINI